MKKSLLALAVLGAFAGVASAQSSVTLYGTIDLNGRYVKADDSRPSPVARPGRHQQQPARLPRCRGSGWRPQGRLRHPGRRQRRHAARPTPSSGIVVRPSACSATPVNCASAATTPRRSGTRRSSTRSAPTVSAARSTSPGLHRHPSGQLDRLLPAVEPRRLLRPGDGRGAAEGGTLGRPCRLATSAADSASLPARSTSRVPTRKRSSARPRRSAPPVAT